MQVKSSMNQKNKYISVIKKNQNLTLYILRKCSVWFDIHVLMHITRSYACISATIDMECKKCTNR